MKVLFLLAGVGFSLIAIAAANAGSDSALAYAGNSIAMMLGALAISIKEGGSRADEPRNRDYPKGGGDNGKSAT